MNPRKNYIVAFVLNGKPVKTNVRAFDKEDAKDEVMEEFGWDIDRFLSVQEC